MDDRTERIMRDAVDNDRISRIMSQPMSPVMEAYVKGFNCAQCNKLVTNRYPVRYNENGPFFDTFYCAWQYRAERFNDTRAQENMEKINRIREEIRNG
jgi:UDP-galactopyranose mutase